MTFVLWLVVTSLWTVCCSDILEEMFIYGSNDTYMYSYMRSFDNPGIKIFGETAVTVDLLREHGITFRGETNEYNFTAWRVGEEPDDFQVFCRISDNEYGHEDFVFADNLVREHFDERYANFTSDHVIVMTAASTSDQIAGQIQIAIIANDNMTFVMFQYNFTSPERVMSDCVDCLIMMLAAGSEENAEFLLTGNTGVKGRWMFRVDLCPQCVILPRNSGFCYREVCVCFDGFAGRLCTELTGGDCHYVVPGVQELCLDEVYPPWGSDIISPCHSSPCHYGVCNETSDGYTCTCPPGYTGTRCQTDLRGCSSSPCVMGSCTNKEYGDYECTCRDGFVGKNCQLMIGICESWSCVNGSCEENSYSHLCNCDPGYRGMHCEAMVDYCASSPCAHGDCISHDLSGFTCERCPGYTGSLCETMIDYCQSSPCTPGLGTCYPVVGGYICLCIDNVFGVNCEIDRRPPVGSYSPWGSWTVCSKHCGRGLQYRYKQCLRLPCLDDNYEIQLCQLMPCPENSLEKEHVVSLLTTKRMIEILQTEQKMFQNVISEVNNYCVTFPDQCCSFVPSISTVAGFRPVLKTEHVSLAHGYPKNVTIGLNQIALVVRAPFSIWYVACGLDLYTDNTRSPSQSAPDSASPHNALPLKHLDFVDKMIYLDSDILARILQKSVVIMNRDEDLCCLSLDPLPTELHTPVGVERNGPIYVLIAIGSVVIVLLLLLIGLSLKSSKAGRDRELEPSFYPSQDTPMTILPYVQHPDTQTSYNNTK